MSQDFDAIDERTEREDLKEELAKMYVILDLLCSLAYL